MMISCHTHITNNMQTQPTTDQFLPILLSLLTTKVEVSMNLSTQLTKHCSVLLSIRLGTLSMHLSQQRSERQIEKDYYYYYYSITHILNIKHSYNDIEMIRKL